MVGMAAVGIVHGKVHGMVLTGAVIMISGIHGIMASVLDGTEVGIAVSMVVTMVGASHTAIGIIRVAHPSHVIELSVISVV